MMGQMGSAAVSTRRDPATREICVRLLRQNCEDWNLLEKGIDRPPGVVSGCVTSPYRVPLWMGDRFVRAEMKELQMVRIGTRYTYLSRNGKPMEYEVFAFEPDKVFGLERLVQNEDSSEQVQVYRIVYHFKPTKDGTWLTCAEGVDFGELKAPLTNATLENLKKVLEQRPWR